MTEDTIFDRTLGTVQQFKTKNDVNGNSRRVWVGYALTGHILRVETEYYARPDWARDIAQLPTITVPPAEYKRICGFLEDAR